MIKKAQPTSADTGKIQYKKAMIAIDQVRTIDKTRIIKIFDKLTIRKSEN